MKNKVTLNARALVREFRRLAIVIEQSSAAMQVLSNQALITLNCPLKVGDIVEFENGGKRKTWARVHAIHGKVDSKRIGWFAWLSRCDKNGKYIGGITALTNNSDVAWKKIS